MSQSYTPFTKPSWVQIGKYKGYYICSYNPFKNEGPYDWYLLTNGNWSDITKSYSTTVTGLFNSVEEIETLLVEVYGKDHGIEIRKPKVN